SLRYTAVTFAASPTSIPTPCSLIFLVAQRWFHVPSVLRSIPVFQAGNATLATRRLFSSTLSSLFWYSPLFALTSSWPKTVATVPKITLIKILSLFIAPPFDCLRFWPLRDNPTATLPICCVYHPAEIVE